MANDDCATSAVTCARFVVCWPLLVALALPALMARPAQASALQDVRDELVQASADLVRKHAAYQDAARAEKEAATGDVTGLAEAVHTPTLDQMRAQDADLRRRESEMSATYGPAYPPLIEIQTRQTKLAADIRIELKRLTAALRSDYEIARAREAALKDSLTDLNDTTFSLSDADATKPPARIETTPALPPTPIVKRPTAASNGPSFLNDFMVVSLSVALLGLFVGLAHTIWRDLRGRRPMPSEPRLAPSPVPAPEPEPRPAAPRDATGNAPAETASATLRDAFILGRIPDAAEASGDLAMAVIDAPDTDFAREIERLAARLLPSSTGGHVVSLFPLKAGQGTTSLMVCLAEAVARNGFRVLLIDADMTDRGMSRALHTAGMRGLAEVLAGLVPAAKLALDQNGVTILPGGRLGFDLRTNAETLAALIAETRERFDLVLIDAGPFDPRAGSAVLCRLSDDFGIVACRDGLPRDLFVASIEAAAAFPSFAGIILNREPAAAHLPLAAVS